MPQKGQKTVTLNESEINVIEPIAEKEERSVAQIVRLLIVESFGTDKTEVKKAQEILTMMREKYN